MRRWRRTPNACSARAGASAMAAKKPSGGGLALDQLLQRLMGSQVLGADDAARQDDQVEILHEHVHQHAIGRQARAAGASEHPPPFDARHHGFDLRSTQHIDQGDRLQVVDTLGDGYQGSGDLGSRNHGRSPLGDACSVGAAEGCDL